MSVNLGCVCAWIGGVGVSWVCLCLDRRCRCVLGVSFAWIGHVGVSWVCLDRLLCGVGFVLFQVEKSRKNRGSNLGTLAFSATLVTNYTNGISHLET